MNLFLAAALVAVVAIVGNRILAVGVGLWFHVPAKVFLSLLIGMDILQIPLFYRLYEQGSSLLDRLPRVQRWLKKDWTQTSIGQWARPLGGPGVMLLAALPTFGGGMWSATFMAYGLRLSRRAGYAWMVLGSLLSYLTLYWILDTLVRTLQYFAH